MRELRVEGRKMVDGLDYLYRFHLDAADLPESERMILAGCLKDALNDTGWDAKIIVKTEVEV